MRSGILRCYIGTLKLRANAPWPSQVARRQRYRMKLLRAVAYNPLHAQPRP